ncbi:MAG: carboxylate-amine ligase, partial [Ignavibacteria bacterium]|nr:carboxylate-amine ligase [Ignavibacteria bacterium]
MKSKLFTLGIEEEFQVIDPVTRELKSHMNQIVTTGQSKLADQIKPEMHQAVVEVGTIICSD